jgi:hypothetical protein
MGDSFYNTIFEFDNEVSHSVEIASWKLYQISSQYNGYINIIDMQINKGCSIEFLSARTILAVSI